MRRVAGHPAEDLGRRGDRADLRGGARLAPHPLGREPGQRVADGGGGDERPDEMAAAALVLARRLLAVLVRTDRDVLGAVVGGELGAAQREHRGRERDEPGHQLLRDGTQPARLADPAHGGRGADHRAEDAAALDRQLRRRQAPLHHAAGARAPRRAGPGRAAPGSRRSRRGSACARPRPRAARPGAGSRTPTSSGRARARRFRAPCRRAGSSPSSTRRSVAPVSARSPPPGAPPGAPARPRRARRRRPAHRRARRRASPRAPTRLRKTSSAPAGRASG